MIVSKIQAYNGYNQSNTISTCTENSKGKDL
jgi:hypothetical protein